MHIGFVGCNGLIAKHLIKYFESKSDIEAISKFGLSGDNVIYLDLRAAADFSEESFKGIDYIIFTAAISSPDRCAEEVPDCWAVNVAGTCRIIDKALKQGCRILFFSSDAVFGSGSGQIYDEFSITAANTPYGNMKKAVEDQYKNNPNFKVIRLSYVISPKDKFVTYCFQNMKDGTVAEIYHPLYRNCIVISDVMRIVDWLISSWNVFPHFALNACGQELVSRVQIADELNRLFENHLKYVIVNPDKKFYRNRPAITHIKSSYLKKYNILKEGSFREKLEMEMEGIEVW